MSFIKDYPSIIDRINLIKKQPPINTSSPNKHILYCNSSGGRCDLNFNYKNYDNKNTGKIIVQNTDNNYSILINDGSYITYNGFSLNGIVSDKYYLNEIIFFTPSKNINLNKVYDLEANFIHISEDNQRCLIISLFFIVNDSDEFKNKKYYQMAKKLSFNQNFPSNKNSAIELNIKNWNFQDFLPDDKSFFNTILDNGIIGMLFLKNHIEIPQLFINKIINIIDLNKFITLKNDIIKNPPINPPYVQLFYSENLPINPFNNYECDKDCSIIPVPFTPFEEKTNIIVESFMNFSNNVFENFENNDNKPNNNKPNNNNCNDDNDDDDDNKPNAFGATDVNFNNNTLTSSNNSTSNNSTSNNSTSNNSTSNNSTSNNSTSNNSTSNLTSNLTSNSTSNNSTSNSTSNTNPKNNSNIDSGDNISSKTNYASNNINELTYGFGIFGTAFVFAFVLIYAFVIIFILYNALVHTNIRKEYLWSGIIFLIIGFIFCGFSLLYYFKASTEKYQKEIECKKNNCSNENLKDEKQKIDNEYKYYILFFGIFGLIISAIGCIILIIGIMGLSIRNIFQNKKLMLIISIIIGIIFLIIGSILINYYRNIDDKDKDKQKIELGFGITFIIIGSFITIASSIFIYKSFKSGEFQLGRGANNIDNRSELIRFGKNNYDLSNYSVLFDNAGNPVYGTTKFDSSGNLIGYSFPKNINLYNSSGKQITSDLSSISFNKDIKLYNSSGTPVSFNKNNYVISNKSVIFDNSNTPIYGTPIFDSSRKIIGYSYPNNIKSSNQFGKQLLPKIKSNNLMSTKTFVRNPQFSLINEPKKQTISSQRNLSRKPGVLGSQKPNENIVSSQRNLTRKPDVSTIEKNIDKNISSNRKLFRSPSVTSKLNNNNSSNYLDSKRNLERNPGVLESKKTNETIVSSQRKLVRNSSVKSKLNNISDSLYSNKSFERKPSFYQKKKILENINSPFSRKRSEKNATIE
jgi:hypothetical protein